LDVTIMAWFWLEANQFCARLEADSFEEGSVKSSSRRLLGNSSLGPQRLRQRMHYSRLYRCTTASWCLKEGIYLLVRVLIIL